jgi:hypothetical protein
MEARQLPNLMYSKIKSKMFPLGFPSPLVWEKLDVISKKDMLNLKEIRKHFVMKSR